MIFSNENEFFNNWPVGVVGLSRIVNTDKVAGSSPALVNVLFTFFSFFLFYYRT